MELQDFLKDVEPLHGRRPHPEDVSSASARGVKRARKSDKKPDPAEMADSEREAS